MSLILEALRRSEAERRRGAPPSLLGDPGQTRPSRAAAWPMALGGLLLGVALAAGVAWWWGQGRATPVAAALPAPAPAVAPAPSPLEPVPPAAYAVPPSPAMPPEAASAPAASAPPPRAATTASATEAPPEASIPKPATAPQDGRAGPVEGDLPWSALSGEAVPPLRLSMHVYADEPSRRFAIVDGQRRREGDPLGGGLTLVEIRRDGLRIGLQGRVFWVPR